MVSLRSVVKSLLPPIVTAAIIQHRLLPGRFGKDSRTFQPKDPSIFPRIEILPAKEYPHCYMKVTTEAGPVTEYLHTSHLCLQKVISEYDFKTVLDIGGGSGPHTRILRHVGKEVTTIEILENFPADHHGDYMEIDFGNRQFDLIWCSHILEHQRNQGMFLEKVFGDLKEDGIFAVTVPDKSYNSMILGHCNIYNSLLLIYHLVCAGFDCRNAKLKSYEGNLSVIVRKRDNGLKRISFATVPFPSPDGSRNNVGHNVDVFRFFPVGLMYLDHMIGEFDEINW